MTSQSSAAQLQSRWQELLTQPALVSSTTGRTLEASSTLIRFSEKLRDGSETTVALVAGASGKLYSVRYPTDAQAYQVAELCPKSANRLVQTWYRETHPYAQLERDWHDITTQTPKGVKALQLRLEGVEDGIQYTSVDTMDSHDTFVMRKVADDSYTVSQVRITRWGRHRKKETQTLSGGEASRTLHGWRTTVEQAVQAWRSKKATA